MIIAVEKHNKKRGIFFKIALFEEVDDAEVGVNENNALIMKMVIEVPKRKTTINFNLIGEFSFFRAIKKIILSIVKARRRIK
ncbi:MAG: hypothetical protein ACFFG0_14450 [Candidatus Thorarchaeota archaeon]